MDCDRSEIYARSVLHQPQQRIGFQRVPFLVGELFESVLGEISNHHDRVTPHRGGLHLDWRAALQEQARKDRYRGAMEVIGRTARALGSDRASIETSAKSWRKRAEGAEAELAYLYAMESEPPLGIDIEERILGTALTFGWVAMTACGDLNPGHFSGPLNGMIWRGLVDWCEGGAKGECELHVWRFLSESQPGPHFQYFAHLRNMWLPPELLPDLVASIMRIRALIELRSMIDEELRQLAAPARTNARVLWVDDIREA